MAWPCSTASTRSRRCSRRRCRRAGVPFRVRGGGRFLDRPEVQVALDDASRNEAANSPAARSRGTSAIRRHARRRTLAEERREHVDALVRLGHEYLEADGGRGSSTGSSSSCRPRCAATTPAARGQRGGAAHVPPGQGTRVRHRVRRRARDGARADLARQDVGGDGRGAASAVRARFSRAERVLHLSWAQRAHGGWPYHRRKPSTWLARSSDGVGPAPLPEGPRQRATQQRTRRRPRAVAGARREPGATAPTSSTTTNRLYTALVDWRLANSRAAGRAGVRDLPQHHPRRPSPVPGRAPSAALLDVPGVGPVKAERYGGAVLGPGRRAPRLLPVDGTGRRQDAAGTGIG